VGGLNAEKYSLVKMNVENEVKDTVLKTLPAITSPTVSRLSDGDYAIETIVVKDKIGNLIVNLMNRGAKGILVQDVEVVV